MKECRNYIQNQALDKAESNTMNRDTSPYSESQMMTLPLESDLLLGDKLLLLLKKMRIGMN